MMTDRQSSSGVSVALLVLPAEATSAGTPPARVVPLVMRASVVGADVSRLCLEVSGPGVDEPVSAELPVENGAAGVTVAVPAGPQRVFALRAYGEPTGSGPVGGGESYAGSASADVRDGLAALLTVALSPSGA